MYGLPTETDLTFMNDASLIQVCIGENEVILHFDNSSTIMIAGNAKIDVAAELDTARDIGAACLTLISSTVVSARPDGSGSLSLTFQGDTTMTLFDTWPEYESYTITFQDRTIVV